MKVATALSLSCTLLFATCSSPRTEPDRTKAKRAETSEAPVEPPAPPELVPDSVLGPARWHDYPEADALLYDVDLVVDPVVRRLTGSVNYEFRALEPLVAVRLDLLEDEEWRVRFFQTKELETRREGDQILVQLEEPAAAGELIRFSARLEGTPPDGFYFGKTRYDRPAAYTDHYSVRARGWLPCEDHPRDRARLRLRVASPPEFEVVVTGAMKELMPAADANVPRRYRLWLGESLTELPTYLFALAVAPFDRIKEPGDDRLVPHFVYREDKELAQQALVHHAEWLRLGERTFGAYPFAKYCVVQIPTRWGGVENAGNTFLSENLFDGDRAGVGTLAHELAHQWFGDGVGYADWSEVWLSEGFASYFGPWLDAATGGPPLSESLENMRTRWLSSPEGRVLPVRWKGYANPDDALNSNTYPKGAWVLHMLRVELGDEDFFEGIRGYYERFVGASATTEDFRAVMEEVSDRDLAGFFEQWIDRPGCPQLELDWGSSGVVVRQVQRQPYDFLLPLRWLDAVGVRHDRRFRIRERETVLELEGAPFLDVQVDPETELLYREP